MITWSRQYPWLVPIALLFNLPLTQRKHTVLQFMLSGVSKLAIRGDQPMFLTEKNRIALISVEGDPAAEIGQEEAGGQNVYVRQVGLALAQQRWQVDMFTRRSSPDQPTVIQHHPNCRTIRLTAGPAEFTGRDELFSYLPEFVCAFQTFQQQEGFQYSLVHTNYWLSSWVGMRLKRHQPLVQVHTYHSLGAVKYRTVANVPDVATKRLSVENACL